MSLSHKNLPKDNFRSNSQIQRPAFVFIASAESAEPVIHAFAIFNHAAREATIARRMHETPTTFALCGVRTISP